MTNQILTVIALLLVLVAYVITLYHRAHGNEAKAIAQGAQIVIDALTKDGQLMPEPLVSEAPEAINIGEEEYEPVEPVVMPDIITARSDKMAEQMGEQINNDLMRHMDEKV